MQDVHPTGTAGDGRIIRSRTAKPGDPADERIQCAQCGFFCKPDRDTEGDSGSLDNNPGSVGVDIQDLTVTIANTAQGLPQPLKDVSSFLESSRTVKDPVVRAGCPLCGSLNYRGHLRDEDPFSRGRDLSDQ